MDGEESDVVDVLWCRFCDSEKGDVRIGEGGDAVRDPLPEMCLWESMEALRGVAGVVGVNGRWEVEAEAKPRGG